MDPSEIPSVSKDAANNWEEMKNTIDKMQIQLKEEFENQLKSRFMDIESKL